MQQVYDEHYLQKKKKNKKSIINYAGVERKIIPILKEKKKKEH